MTKLVLKTVAITLVAVLSACLVTFGSLALFAPKSVANFFDGLGMYKPAIHYYEKQYGKSQNIEDLAVLILKLDGEKDSVKTEGYLKAMVEHQDYSNYCNKLDTENSSTALSTDEFYRGKFAVSLVRNGKIDDALNVSAVFVESKGYTEYNPFSTIVFELGELLNDEQLTKLEGKIRSYENNLNFEQSKALIQADIQIILQLKDNN